MRRARLALRYPREARRNAVIQYVGKYWSQEGSDEEVPINLIALYVSIVSRGLIAKNPRVMLSTFQRQNKPVVNAMQTWINKEIDKMHLDSVLQRWVIDALFSIGIIKVGLSTPSDAAHLAWNLRAGQPFASTIDLDDFVYDIHARDWSEVSFIGHRYRVPLDTVKDSSLYTKARKTLTASYDPLYNVEGDERISVLGRTVYANDEQSEFEEMVDLWEVYLPRRRLVITLAADNAGNPEAGGYDDDYLRVQRWVGPDNGPYHILGIQKVPGNIMPKAPIQDLYDLHILANNLYRKLTRQAERQKSLLLVAGSAMEDAARIQTASDGDIVRVDNPERHKLVAFEAVSQVNFQMFIDAVQRFSFMAGNLEMMGGLGPQSKTATQDKILNQNAGGTAAAMQDTVQAAVQNVIEALCWYFHHDPFKVQKSTFSVPGMPEISVARAITPDQRQNVKWDELDIKIDPYSLQTQTPQQRLLMLQQNLTQIIMPMMALLQQQGIMVDMNEVLRKIGTYQDDPDLQDILTIAEPPQQEQAGEPQKPPMPTQTERTYNRVEGPGRTQQGDAMNAINALRGINPGGNPQTTAESA